MKKFQIKYLILAVAMTVFLFPFKVLAHPGRTASDGCHYCRTNCSSWGEVSGTRHCHGGYTAPVVKQPPAPVITQPSPYIPKPSPTPVIIQTIPSPVPSPISTPKPSPTPSPIQSPAPVSTQSPEVLGEKTESSSGGGIIVTFIASLGYIFWRAINQKWPFHTK